MIERLQEISVAEITSWKQELIAETVAKRDLEYGQIVSDKKLLERAKIEYMLDIEENIENIIDEDYLRTVWCACLEYCKTESS